MDRVEDIEDALDIAWAETPNLRVEDCRRLTGPGLLWDHPGAVVEVIFEEFESAGVIAVWKGHARQVLDAIGWTGEHVTARGFAGGANLAISAPMDQLYSAVFVAQSIWHLCAAELLDQTAGDFGAMVTDLRGVMIREANPALIALLNAGRARGLDVLCDDDAVSVGHGTGSQTWPVDRLPGVRDVDWDRLHNLPVALVTGTNGKTTTTRLITSILRGTGMVAGLTSTDFVQVGDEVLERGDFSGPGGARRLLRDRRLQVACLEVARGGLLRRGLVTQAARVAVVTNVAADHLGQYGVNTLEELARAKFAVHRALAPDGVLVLNADDPNVVAEAARTDATIWWFSQDPGSTCIAKAMTDHRPCAWARDGWLVFSDGQHTSQVAQIGDIPITMAGAAQHGILNALAATCVARALGVDDSSIGTGLTGFHNDPRDNPGRLNEFSINGARIFVDYAHNPHAIAAVTRTIAAIPAKRRIVLASMPGDRSDQDIAEVTRIALGLRPDIVLAAELPDYLRGRASGEVTGLMANTCRDEGLEPDQIMIAPDPLQGVQRVVDMLVPGDVALFLVLSHRNSVMEVLSR